MEEEVITLYEFDDSWDLKTIHINRKDNGCPLDITIDINKFDEFRRIKLLNCREYEAVEKLLYADRIVLSKYKDPQLEFGRFCIECFDECYAFFTCDKIEELILYPHEN